MDDKNNVISLTADDVRVALQLQSEIVRAEARLQAMVDAQRLFIDDLRQRYGADETFELRDWMKGFERAERDDG